MNRLFIAGALAASALASVPAFAQGYVGANVGVSHANRGCGAADATGTAFSCDKNDTAYKLCFETDDLEATRAAVLAAGGLAKEPWVWEGTRYCECADPEGNVVQLFVRGG